MLPLKIHPKNPHLLGSADGVEMFLLGDTAWQLLQRLSRDEIQYYLDNRAAKGFNLICTVFLSEFDGLRVPNQESHVPLDSFEPIQINAQYLDLVKFLLTEANQRGIFVGLLPTWGDKMTAPWGIGPRIFEVGDEAKCFDFGKLLAEGLKDHSNILWVLGGDRPANLSKTALDWPYPWQAGFTVDTDWEPLWRAMSQGIVQVLPEALFAFHPQGGSLSTSQLIHKSDWLDINMIQSGHGGGHDIPIWDWIGRDYAMRPAKPTLDAEPNYEDHPVSPWPTWDPASGYFDEYDVRKQCYRSVFAGGCGVIYGHHCVWQFWSEGREPIMWPQFDWKTALDRPGAHHVGQLRKLLNRFDQQVRMPDQSVFVRGQGSGAHAKCCMRTEDWQLVMIYLPMREALEIWIPTAPGTHYKLEWMSPINLVVQGESFVARPDQPFSIEPPEGLSPDVILILSRVLT